MSEHHTPAAPLARVKRIIKQDDEIVAVSSGAVYAVAAATDLFIKFFTEQAWLVSKGDKRKKVQYQDFANAVTGVDHLEFLSDLVPRTVPYKKVAERRRATNTAEASKGQTTLQSNHGTLTAALPKDKEEDENRSDDSDNEAQMGQIESYDVEEEQHEPEKENDDNEENEEEEDSDIEMIE